MDIAGVVFILLILGIPLLWFIVASRRKLAYQQAVEDELKRECIDIATLSNHYGGLQNYYSTIKYMRQTGLSPAEVAKAIVSDLSKQPEKNKTESNIAPIQQEDSLMSRVKTVYELSGKLAESLASKYTKTPINFFQTMEFSIEVTAFVVALKRNMDVEIEDGSIGKKLVDAVTREDVDTLTSVHSTVAPMIHQLSADDRAGYVFHMFWPTLHREIATS